MTNIHDEIQSLLAAYVMDAVPADEMPAIRAHILSCEECWKEADSYAESLGALAMSAEPSALPTGFADRVVREAIGDREAARAPSPRPSWFRRRGALAFGTAFALIAIAVTSVSLIGSVQRERRYESIVAALLREDSALRLQGPGGAAAVVAPIDGGMTLVATNLGAAPDGSDYQLWLMKDGVPTPSETFDVSGSIVIVDSELSVEDFDGAAITVEPDGGSRQPTTEPVLST